MSDGLAGLVAVLRRRQLRRCERLGHGIRVRGHVWLYGGGRVRLGDRVVLDATRGPIELHADPGALLVLGDDVRLEGGVSIEAVESVVVERGATVGAWTKILDNHFHPLDGNRDIRPTSGPVWIGPGARIGERCVVLPGTRLEAGVRLGPGVVIGRRVPAGVALEGHPPHPVPREERP
jgi:acetyltransferase-like isoleucine patch superfamily enzyme